MRFYLIPYLLNGGEKKYKSVFYPNETLDLDALIDKYMMMYGTSVTRTDARMVIDLFFRAVEDAMADGNTLQTDLFRARIKVEGTFENILDNFNKNQHRVRPQFIASVALLDRFAERKAKLIQNPRFQTKIYSMEDRESGSVNGQITPGGLASVKGKKLIFNEKDEEQGYFLIDENDQITRIDRFMDNLPSSCYFQLPKTLSPGRYTLEFRGTPGEGRAAVRVILAKPLFVEREAQQH